MATTTGQLCKDIEEIADWIGAVQGVLRLLDPTIGIPVGRWEPPPTATPAPIASPKCLRPSYGTNPITTTGDLVVTLGVLREWEQSVALTLGRLNGQTKIP
jgi:hypothetical protein